MYCYIIGLMYYVIIFCLFGVGYGSLIRIVNRHIQESHLYLCSGLSMFCFRSWFSARITPIRYRIIMVIMVCFVLVGYSDSVGYIWIVLLCLS